MKGGGPGDACPRPARGPDAIAPPPHALRAIRRDRVATASPRDGPRAQAFAGHAEDHWINVVTSRAGGAFAEVRRASRAPQHDRARPAQLWEASLESDVLGVLAVISFEW